MIKKIIHKTFLLLFMLLLSISASSGESDGFSKILNDHNMVFKMPDGFKQTSVIENEDVSYQYAIKSSKYKLEIRYAVFSLKKQLKEYDEWKNSKNKNGVKADPNKGYEVFTRAVVENIAGGESYRYGIFDKESVKNEFYADWGGTYLADASSEFGKGYKKALIIALHKDNTADAYIIYLFDDYKDVQGEITRVFYNMRFMSDYFNKKSVLFSAAYVISSITKEQISPLTIGEKVNFNESDKFTIDDYLTKIAGMYSLKVNKINLKKMQDVVNLLNDGGLIVVIYVNKKVSHSAVIRGYKVEGEKLILRVYDSGLEIEDFIDASSLLSSFWKLKPDHAYYFSR